MKVFIIGITLAVVCAGQVSQLQVRTEWISSAGTSWACIALAMAL
jgi:hypothetical protein